MSVDLETAKEHLRVRHREEDSLIRDYMAAAVAWLRRYIGPDYDQHADDVRVAELMLIGHFYQNREATTSSRDIVREVPLAVEAIAGPYRTPTLS